MQVWFVFWIVSILITHKILNDIDTKDTYLSTVRFLISRLFSTDNWTNTLCIIHGNLDLGSGISGQISGITVTVKASWKVWLKLSRIYWTGSSTMEIFSRTVLIQRGLSRWTAPIQTELNWMISSKNGGKCSPELRTHIKSLFLQDLMLNGSICRKVIVIWSLTIGLNSL